MRESTIQALPYKGEIHKKAWGHELWIINNEKYCGKLLVFKANKQFSMHYHMLKDEAWYINKGEFEYKYIDTETAELRSKIVREGDCIHLIPGQPHQMLALQEGSCIFEVSTQHFDSDSYRILPGASQDKNNNEGLPF
jgi:quercetin dioxygenase-like cupin family protein|tara:strand:- start:1059 stop:1472 length:414 start_codon:yes stop_codon:yes gene_type:complete